MYIYSLEPGPSRARYFPRDMLLLTTTARERAWYLLKITSPLIGWSGGDSPIPGVSPRLAQLPGRTLYIVEILRTDSRGFFAFEVRMVGRCMPTVSSSTPKCGVWKTSMLFKDHTRMTVPDTLRSVLSGTLWAKVPSCFNGVYSSKWRPAARAKGGGHSQTRGRAGVPEISESTVFFDWLVLHVILFNSNNTVEVFSSCCCSLLLFILTIHFISGYFFLIIFWLKKKKLCKWEIKSVGIENCVGSMNAESSSCPTIISSLSKSVPMIPRHGHQMCTVLLVGDVAWKTGRNHWGLSFFLARRGMSITDYRSRSISWVRASFLYMHREPPKLVLFCSVSRSTFHEFPFFFFFSSSVVALHAQTLNNVGPLDCKFRLLRRRPLLSLGGKISVAEVMHLLTLNVFAANFRVVLVVVTFFLSFSLWWIWTVLFILVESLVSESTLIETSFARQPHGASPVSSLPSSPLATAPESWIFGAHNVQALRRWGRPRQGMFGALEKKTWAWGMSPNLKFHTPANPHTCTEQTYESNGRFLDEPWWPRLLLSKFLPFPTVIRHLWIHGKVLLWNEVAGFGGTCRSRKDVDGRVFGDHRPVSPGTGGSLFPSVVQPGATPLLCDL